MHELRLEKSKTRFARRTLLHGGIGLALASPQFLRADSSGRRDVGWLEQAQTQPKVIPASAPRLSGIRDPETGEPFADRRAWEKHRAKLRDQWLDFLGPLSRAKRDHGKIQMIAEDRPDGVIRQLIRYRVEQDQTVEAYLLRPREKKARRPAVAVFHSTINHSILQPAGLQGRQALAFGLVLARRGHVTLCPRNYLWPRTRKLAAHDEAKRFHQRHPRSKGMARMLYDAQIAVDILAAQADVDPNRIGAVGHSLGAKEVLYLAAFDSRVKATVSSEGGMGTRFSNWDAPWYLGKTITDDGFQLEHHQLLALMAPRSFLLVGGDSADGDRSWPFIEAAMPIYRLYAASDVRPRLGLFNHRQGHSVPKEAECRIYEWLTTYL